LKKKIQRAKIAKVAREKEEQAKKNAAATQKKIVQVEKKINKTN